jgi:hypothetical protein
MKTHCTKEEKAQHCYADVDKKQWCGDCPILSMAFFSYIDGELVTGRSAKSIESIQMFLKNKGFECDVHTIGTIINSYITSYTTIHKQLICFGTDNPN